MVPSFAPQAVGFVPTKFATVSNPPLVPVTLKVAVAAPVLVKSTEAGLDKGANPFMAI